MESGKMHGIPVVDLAKEDLKPGSSAWLSACHRVRLVLEEYGCFIAVYDKVPLELHNTIFSTLEELFDLPSEIKVKNTNDVPFHSYLGQISTIPLHEALCINDATNIEEIQSFTNLMWPAGNYRFCESAHLFSKMVAELDQMVVKMVFESYGVEKYSDSHIGSMTYLLRPLKYRAPKMMETNLGLNSHKDKSFMTILQQNQVDGLEIETKDGEWIGFEPSSCSSFLVMAGDALMGWSNGRIHSPNHRVVMKGKEVRYSIGLFSYKRGVIQIPEELVDNEHRLHFKPFHHLEFVRFARTAEGRKADCTLKAYCGV